jgi:hypothetical protein
MLAVAVQGYIVTGLVELGVQVVAVLEQTQETETPQLLT